MRRLLLFLLLPLLGCLTQLHVHEVYNAKTGQLTQRTRTSQRVLGTADVAVATSKGDMVGEGKDGGISDNFARVVPCIAGMAAGGATGIGAVLPNKNCQPPPVPAPEEPGQ